MRHAKAGRLSSPSIENVAAYIYVLLSASGYQERFTVALERPGLRLPLTADSALWIEAVAASRKLLWLHTYAERLVDPADGRLARVPDVEGVGCGRPVNRLPEAMSEIAHEAENGALTIGDGQVGGVRADVWAYSVSGMQVMTK